MNARKIRVAALSACAIAPALALAADPIIRVENAWVRPANPDQPATPLYADVTSDTPVKLVGAASEAAKRAALFVGEATGDGATPKPVSAIDISAGGKLRLAPRGAFVELREITRFVRPGDSVPFALEFTTADGKPLRVTAQAVVRGILPRPTERADGTSDTVTTPSTDGVPMPGN